MFLYTLFYFANCHLFSSVATYYFRTGPNIPGCIDVQTFNDNQRYGPCNFNGTFGVKYTSKSQNWAAIKNAKRHCGKDIIVRYKNRLMTLKIMDECPACSKGNRVDMSLEALIKLTGSKNIACAIHRPLPKITWRFKS